MVSIGDKVRRGIIFIGMSGSGKTTIGKILAPKIDYHFIDSDRLIEKKYGKPLQTIVDSYSDKREFLKMEDEVVSAITLDKSILATGGSTCYSGETLKGLEGALVFLQISWEALAKRLGSFVDRGVIILHKNIQEEYRVRQKMYINLADVVIDCNYRSKNAIVNEVRTKLGL